MLQSQVVKIVPLILLLVTVFLFYGYFYVSENETISTLHEQYASLATHSKDIEQQKNDSIIELNLCNDRIQDLSDLFSLNESSCQSSNFKCKSEILQIESINQQMKTQHKIKVENLTNQIEVLKTEISTLQFQLQTNKNESIEFCEELQKKWESKMTGEGLDSETLKKFQPFWANHPGKYQTMKALLKFFQDFVTKHSITGFISSGTLLGAVRHNGLIPWDDDIDALVATEDFVKFNTTYKNEISEAGFEILKFHSGLKLFPKNAPKFPKYGWAYPFLDIFEGFNLGSSNFSFHIGPRVCKKQVNLPIKPICVDGILMNGPNDPEEWLKCVYGEKVFSECNSGAWNHLLEELKTSSTMKCSDLTTPDGGYNFASKYLQSK